MKSRPSGHKLLHSVTVIAKSATDTPPPPPPPRLFLSQNSNYTCSGVFYI